MYCILKFSICPNMSTFPYSFKSTVWDYLYACVYASVCTCVCVCTHTHDWSFRALQRKAGICNQPLSTFLTWLSSCFSWPSWACFQAPSLHVHLPPALHPTPCWCSSLLDFLPLQAHSLGCTFLLHGMCLYKLELGSSPAHSGPGTANSLQGGSAWHR